MFKLLVALLLIVTINGCGTKKDIIKLPKSETIKAIYSLNIDMNDKYLGTMKLKSGKEKGKLITNNEKIISEILNLIKKNVNSWKQLPNGRTSSPSKLYAFLDHNNKPVLVLWLFKNELTILTKPIDPRNVHWSYSLDNQSSIRLTKYLDSWQKER